MIKKTTLLILILCFSSTISFSQSRDFTFGINGYVKESLIARAFAVDFVVQPDKKILVGARTNECSSFCENWAAIIRYNADGTRDLTFGDDGAIVFQRNGTGTSLNDVDQYSDGKILASGIAGVDYFFTRFHPDGSLDTSFGNNGTILISSSGVCRNLKIKILSDDSILSVVRYCYQGNLRKTDVIKYDQDGVLDTSFGSGGTTGLEFGFDDQAINDFVITPDAKIALVGSAGDLNSSNELEEELFVVRLLENGSFDTGFNGTGLFTHPITATTGILVQPDGKLLLTGIEGFVVVPSSGDIAIMRLTESGALDTSFSGDGYDLLNIDTAADYGNALALQEDGKIIIGGRYFDFGGGTGYDEVLARYNSNGTLDTTFGDAGVIDVGSSGGGDEIFRLLWQDDFRLLSHGKSGPITLATGRFIIEDAAATIDIPDANFEQRLQSLGLDTDGTINGQIFASDALPVTSLDISSSGIVDLTGLEGFINLEVLDFSDNSVSSVDLALNTALTSVDGSSNQLTSFSVNQNTGLTDITVNNNNLVDLDFSTNLLLENLNVSNNALESLSVKNGNNTNLVTFNATQNPLLTCIEVDTDIIGNIPAGWLKDATADYQPMCPPDFDPPTVITQDITVSLDANGMVMIAPLDVDNGSFDNVTATPDLVFSLDVDTFDCTDIGANTVTLTVTDESGNMASDTATVTVEDNLPPNVIAQDITLQLDALGMASTQATSVDNGSDDNCEVDTLTIDVQDFDCTDIGDTTVTLTATDPSGNMASDTATITVVDDIAPIVQVQDITVDLAGAASISIMPGDVDNGSTDNCNFSLSLDNDTFTSPGDYSVMLSATDSSGNSASDQATVTVIDSTLGVDDFGGAEVRIFPNPVENVLFVETSLPVQSVVIFDLLGRRQLQFLEESTLDVGPLSTGIYFARITLENGETGVFRLLKE